MPDTERKLRVFLCHASQDKPVVRELYQRLLIEGWIDPWLDEEKLLPGQDWDMEIEKAVESADAVVVCLSRNSVVKEGHIQKELKMVLDVSDQKPEGVIFLIPLRLDECQPPHRLTKWQFIDYFPNATKSETIKRLIISLKIRAELLEIIHGEKKETLEDTSNNDPFKTMEVKEIYISFELPNGNYPTLWMTIPSPKMS